MQTVHWEKPKTAASNRKSVDFTSLLVTLIQNICIYQFHLWNATMIFSYSNMGTHQPVWPVSMRHRCLCQWIQIQHLWWPPELVDQRDKLVADIHPHPPPPSTQHIKPSVYCPHLTKMLAFSFLLKKLMPRMFGWRQHGASREQNNIEMAVPSSPPTWRRY